MNSELVAKLDVLADAWEKGLIPRLAQHEVHPEVHEDSRERYLYFTLPVTINFQRSSPAMWQAAFKTYHDPETNYLFFPEKLAETDYAKIQADLRRHSLSLQPNKHTLIWTTIAKTFHEFYNDDPREFLKSGNFDAAETIKLLQETHRDRFPYLRGDKLSNYWLYILSHFTDSEFINADAISIIPDTHVIQSSVRLGLIDDVNMLPGKVADVWHTALSGSKYRGIDIHPILWNWSRAGFPEFN